MYMLAIHSCGDIKAGREYRVLERGLDWYTVRINGKTRFVYSWVFDLHPLKEVIAEIRTR